MTDGWSRSLCLWIVIELCGVLVLMTRIVFFLYLFFWIRKRNDLHMGTRRHGILVVGIAALYPIKYTGIRLKTWTSSEDTFKCVYNGILGEKKNIITNRPSVVTSFRDFGIPRVFLSMHIKMLIRSGDGWNCDGNTFSCNEQRILV